jgi:hypothetical protein
MVSFHKESTTPTTFTSVQGSDLKVVKSTDGKDTVNGNAKVETPDVVSENKKVSVIVGILNNTHKQAPGPSPHIFTTTNYYYSVPSFLVGEQWHYPFH